MRVRRLGDTRVRRFEITAVMLSGSGLALLVQQNGPQRDAEGRAWCAVGLVLQL